MPQDSVWWLTQKEEMAVSVRFQSRENCRSCTEILHVLLRTSSSSPALSLATQVHWGNESLYLLPRGTKAVLPSLPPHLRCCHRLEIGHGDTDEWTPILTFTSLLRSQLPEEPVFKQVVEGKRDRITQLFMEQAWRSLTDWRITGSAGHWHCGLDKWPNSSASCFPCWKMKIIIITSSRCGEALDNIILVQA